MKKALLIILGIGCNILGLIGIAVPGLPTTPFLLLAAALYVRSSDRLYQRLMKSKLFGPYIRNFREHRGMTLKAKWCSILTLWPTMIVSFLVTDFVWLRVTLPIVGTIATLMISLYLKTVPPENMATRKSEELDE